MRPQIDKGDCKGDNLRHLGLITSCVSLDPSPTQMSFQSFTCLASTCWLTELLKTARTRADVRTCRNKGLEEVSKRPEAFEPQAFFSALKVQMKSRHPEENVAVTTSV